MQARGLWCVVLVVCLGGGCSASSEDDSRTGNAGSGKGDGGGTDGKGGDQDFGNGEGGLPPTFVLDDGGTECELGKFCPTDEVDPMNCGSITIGNTAKVTEVPGNVLVVFDRSGSMDDAWGTEKRFEAAGRALIDALTPIAGKVTAGAVFFPSPGDKCAVNAITAADQINFVPGAQFLDQLDGDPATSVPPMYTPISGGNTPLLDGVLQADAALQAATLTGDKSAIIITDGAPNCTWSPNGPTVTRDTVTKWLGQGVTTYVIGLPGSSGAQTVLNDLAIAGGTMQYIEPTNAAALQQQLATIVSQTVSSGFDSCTITLDEPANQPEKLHLVVKDNGVEQDVPHIVGQDQAWTISPDGATVQLLGFLCEYATMGRFESIRFEFGCVELPPLPPPPPIVPG